MVEMENILISSQFENGTKEH